MSVFAKSIDHDSMIVGTYRIAAAPNATVADVAWAIAIGQSIGNPNARSKWETEELFEKHACRILGDQDDLRTRAMDIVRIAYPIVNIDPEDGISQILAHVMGGHLDMDIVNECKLIDISIPSKFQKHFKGPKYGISGIRRYLDNTDKPLIGGIIKPKTGMSVQKLVAITREMVEGGIDFIKEDEIMANPACCPLVSRVPAIVSYLRSCGRKVIYAFCITGDPDTVMRRAKLVHSMGGDAVHINWWSGLGIYRSVRDLDLPLFLFYQKSGNTILTDPRNPYEISEKVLLRLAALAGVDFAHAGMWGGYLNENVSALEYKISTLRDGNVMPSLSCGMHPGLVDATRHLFGIDFMASAGGAIHSHPGGTRAGAAAFRQAVDGEPGPELEQAIIKWGKAAVPSSIFIR